MRPDIDLAKPQHTFGFGLALRLRSLTLGTNLRKASEISLRLVGLALLMKLRRDERVWI